MQAAILDEEDGLECTFGLNDALDALVHLVLNPVGCLRDVIDGLGVDSALCNKFVSLELVDCSPLHFLL